MRSGEIANTSPFRPDRSMASPPCPSGVPPCVLALALRMESG
ncbi:hypothetical protein [Bradyrhizobium sp. CCBAU 051011]|nr:hypothetical protein [Bradyrhizobium sp. CCBAU 051011]